MRQAEGNGRGGGWVSSLSFSELPEHTVDQEVKTIFLILKQDVDVEFRN